MKKLVLASTSPYRQAMLQAAGIPAEAVASDVDETPHAGESPRDLVVRLANEKAHAVARTRIGAIVLGFDQVAIDPDDPNIAWGKPANPQEHLRRLKAMRGKAHQLVTGCCITSDGEHRAFRCVTTMWVRSDLTEGELQAYVQTGEGTFCAGGYAAEGKGSFLFEKVDGDWFNVLGLPLFEVQTALRSFGWRFGQ